MLVAVSAVELGIQVDDTRGTGQTFLDVILKTRYLYYKSTPDGRPWPIHSSRRPKGYLRWLVVRLVIPFPQGCLTEGLLHEED